MKLEHYVNCLLVQVSNSYSQVKTESYQWGSAYNQSKTVNKTLEKNHMYYWYQDRSALGIFTYDRVIYQNCGIVVNNGIASIPVSSVTSNILFDVY